MEDKSDHFLATGTVARNAIFLAMIFYYDLEVHVIWSRQDSTDQCLQLFVAGDGIRSLDVYISLSSLKRGSDLMIERPEP